MWFWVSLGIYWLLSFCAFEGLMLMFALQTAPTFLRTYYSDQRVPLLRNYLTMIYRYPGMDSEPHRWMLFKKMSLFALVVGPFFVSAALALFVFAECSVLHRKIRRFFIDLPDSPRRLWRCLRSYLHVRVPGELQEGDRIEIQEVLQNLTDVRQLFHGRVFQPPTTPVQPDEGVDVEELHRD